MQKVLLVTDMQNDFVDGVLGSAEAIAIVPDVVKRVEEAIVSHETIIFMRDTHHEDYMNTQEGRNLPVIHCIEGSDGWQIIPQLIKYTEGRTVINKPTFGSYELGKHLREINEKDPIEQINVIGLCTDICVISNAYISKMALPEVPIVVESKCCAGITPEGHNLALEAMKICQVKIV